MDRKSAKIPIVRLLEKVDIKPGQCWEWKGMLNPGGYGVMSIAKEKRNVLVHRYFYSFVLGIEIPEGKQVCHKCDNPKCVNPDHLYIGDAYTNVHDMMDRGRARKALGNKVNTSKLSEDEVREARRLFDQAGWKISEIADLFGLSRNAMAAVVKRKVWKWLE